MVGRTEAEAREVAAELTGRPGAELTLARGECQRAGGPGREDTEWRRWGWENREWGQGLTPGLWGWGLGWQGGQ